MSALDDLKEKPVKDLTLVEKAILFIHDEEKYDAGYIDTYEAAAENAALRERLQRLEAAIVWALGYIDFGVHAPLNAHPYWWRAELRKRAGMTNDEAARIAAVLDGAK